MGIEARFEQGADIIDPMWVADLDVRGIKLVVCQLVCRVGHDQGIHTHPLGAVADIDATLFLAGLVHQEQDLALALKGHVAVGVDIIHGRCLR